MEAPPVWTVPGAPGPHRRAQPDPCPRRTSRTTGAGVSRDPVRRPIPGGPAWSQLPRRHPLSSWWSWWSAADLDGLRFVRERSLFRHREATDLPSWHAAPGPRWEGWGGARPAGKGWIPPSSRAPWGLRGMTSLRDASKPGARPAGIQLNTPERQRVVR